MLSSLQAAWDDPEKHASRVASLSRGEDRETSKLTDDAVRFIRVEHDRVKAEGGRMGDFYKEISKKYGIHTSLATMVAKRKRWKHVV